MSSQVAYLTKESSVEERVSYLLAERDKKAIELIFQHYGSLLLNIINKVVHDDNLSEDVLQTVLLKIWRNSDHFNNQKGSLFTWLVAISRNAAIDKTRTKDYRLTQTSKNGIDIVSIKDDYSEEAEVDRLYLQQMINQLPDVQRKLIDMSYFQGFTHKEISDKLDMPLGTVKSRIRLAIKHLRGVI